MYLDCGFSAWVGEGNNWCSPYKGKMWYSILIPLKWPLLQRMATAILQWPLQALGGPWNWIDPSQERPSSWRWGGHVEWAGTIIHCCPSFWCLIIRILLCIQRSIPKPWRERSFPGPRHWLRDCGAVQPLDGTMLKQDSFIKETDWLWEESDQMCNSQDGETSASSHDSSTVTCDS